jgi:hypothetical protein
MLKNLLKLYCIWTWDPLGYFGGFFCFVSFGFFPPLMRKQQNYFWDTISRIGGWGTNTKISKTETVLHLNLEDFFLFWSSLYLSHACLAYCWLVHYLSLFISLTLFFCFVFLLVYLFLPFFFTFFPFPLLSPFHSKYHHCEGDSKMAAWGSKQKACS